MRPERLAAPAMAAIAAALFAGTLVLAFSAVDSARSSSLVSINLSALLFPLVGSVIALRRPGNRIGWLFGATGILWLSGAVATDYAVWATDGRAAPGAWLAAWYGEWNWIAFWFATLFLTPVLFPTGRPPSRRWRSLVRAVLAVVTVLIVLAMMDARLEVEGTRRVLANPLSTPLGADPDETWSGALLFPLMLLSGVSGGIALVQRYRHATDDERLQLKWFTFACLVVIGSFISIALIETAVTEQLAGIAISLVPITAGIAIMRYRLYNIDVIINRTLVYVSLSGVLIALYAGSVVVLQQALAPFTAQNDLAVAASTLAVAALFGPARQRVQAFIDRRLYRARYDAALALESFRTKMRDEVDLDAVMGALLGLVHSTVRPEHASIVSQPGRRA